MNDRKQWKVADEYLPYHPKASHVNPDYRDGWNACYEAQKMTNLTTTRDGITMPADYSFAAVNHFVHRDDVQFEEMQGLCLGLASEIEKLRAAHDF